MEKTVSINEKGLRIGQDHQRARYSDGEIEQVLKFRDLGWGYRRIARVMEMPRSTVRKIARFEIRAQFAVGYRVVPIPG